MASVLSRTTKSLKAGVSSAEHEVLLTEVFCAQANRRIKANIADMTGKSSSLDKKRVCASLLDSKLARSANTYRCVLLCSLSLRRRLPASCSTLATTSPSTRWAFKATLGVIDAVPSTAFAFPSCACLPLEWRKIDAAKVEFLLTSSSKEKPFAPSPLTPAMVRPPLRISSSASSPCNHCPCVHVIVWFLPCVSPVSTEYRQPCFW
jgi:hypothetical protein